MQTNFSCFPAAFDPTGARRRRLGVLATALAVVLALAVVSPAFGQDGFDLVVSGSSDRSDAVALDGAVVEGDAYVFTRPGSGVSRVRFYLDDPGMAGSPRVVEKSAPHDFAGTYASGAAKPFDTGELSDGSHTITAAIDLREGGSVVLEGVFEVRNNAPGELAFDREAVSFAAEPGDSVAAKASDLAVSDGTQAFYSVAEDAPWLDVGPLSGQTPESLALSVDTDELEVGSYQTTVTATAPGYGSDTLEVSLHVRESLEPDLVMVIDQTATSLTVGWHTWDLDTPSEVQHRPAGTTEWTTTAGAPDPATGPGRHHRAFVGGLEAATAYEYRVRGDKDWSRVYAATTSETPPPSTSDYSLLVSTSADRSDPVPLAGYRAAGNIYVYSHPTTDVARVRFYLDDPLTAGSPTTTENYAPHDFAGTASDGLAKALSTRDLSNGPHTITAEIDLTDNTTDTVHADFQVDNAKTCGPLSCTEALVDELPYELGFDENRGKILDGDGIGTGFTYLDEPSRGTGYVPANLQVDQTDGRLHVTTTKGLNMEGVNSQDNALAVGIDAPSQTTAIAATIVDPPAGSGKYEQAGIWFGNDEDNYDKLVVISTRTGTKIEHSLEVGGERVTSNLTGKLNLGGAAVTLTLVADPATRKLTATYRIATGAEQTLGSFSAPGEFFSFDAAGIDPAIGTRSFGGILASHRKGAKPLTYPFDRFGVYDGGAPVPGGVDTSEIAFDRATFPVSTPTSMAWGPDGRLYVLEMFGKVHAIRLDAEKQVLSDEVITTLGTRLALGIAVDPQSTPDDVTLWVSHSSPSLDDGVPNSGRVTRLSGPGFADRTDVITGLPRAKANHATNSIRFGPDDRLYLAQGGNTGAGAPNTAGSEFGTMEEQPLSAAMLVADVRSPTFDGSCANDADIFGAPPCDVEVYSSGLRNTYDFVWHSNGSLYAPDNGLGVKGSFPPSPSPPCLGFGSTSPWTLGGNNPGDQPDTLNLLEPGKYYGHPNPHRDECVFKDGTYQDVAAPPNYQPPLHDLGANRSANGTIEYLADAFCGDLRGDLLIANYSVGDDLTRVTLSEDGQSVAQASSLVGGFNDPLPVAQGPDGTIYVGELGASRVTALKPADLGCWDEAPAAPEAILDAGGTALGGKIYLVAGKTASGYRSNVRVFDPAAGTWTDVANLPGPGVENPAVVAHDGRLYAFGGSTAPFSGAVRNAAVFDPDSGEWAPLPQMPTARGGAAAQVLDGKIYVVGGMDGSGASVAAVEIFDPVARTWSTATPMTTRRDNPGAATLDGRLYVFGGRTRDSGGATPDPTLRSVEMLDPALDEWVAREPMPTGRRTMVVGRLNGRAQLIGGEIRGDGGSFADNEEYDAATDTWRVLRSIPTGRHGAVAGTVDGRIYVIGGGPTGGSAFTALNESFSFR